MARIYDELAEWYPLLTHVKDYEEEATFFTRLLEPRDPKPTLLELGCGQGANAFYMNAAFDLTLVDLSEPMLALSRRLNPELPHLIGDMRTVRLDRSFDRVFVHDAITYITSSADLERTIKTVAAHLAADGIALLAPDYLKENFVSGWDDGGHDGPDGRGLRYVEHCQDPDPEDETYQVDLSLMLREPDGSIRVEHDRHIEGLFPRQTWLDLAAKAGLSAETVVFEHSDLDEDHVYELILCRKASA